MDGGRTLLDSESLYTLTGLWENTKHAQSH